MQNTNVAYDSKVEVKSLSLSRCCHKFDPQALGLADAHGSCLLRYPADGNRCFAIRHFRFGMEVMRFSPRQADCMIVSGTVTTNGEVIRRIYEQMAEPKWVVAMGACASTGGMYRSYATLQGVDRIIPAMFMSVVALHVQRHCWMR